MTTVQIKMSQLGDGLRLLRGNMKLRELSEMVALTNGHICEMEGNQKIPSMNVMERYARKLGVKIVVTFGE